MTLQNPIKLRECARNILGVVCLVAMSAQADAATGIEWHSDLRRAQADAIARDCPLWIQFTGPWCHLCHRMERESFVDPKVVGRARSSFVAVRLQADHHEDLVHSLGITRLPATVIARPNGEIIVQNEGYLDAVTFHSFLDQALVRFSPPRPVMVRHPQPSAVSPLGMLGFCPVSLVLEQKLVAGQESVNLSYEGVTYRFATPLARAVFLVHPERFVPVNGGRCPVNTVDRGESKGGDPHFGVLYLGHLYVCSSASERDEFLRHPDRYAHVNGSERELCLHCWGRDRFLVQRTAAQFPLPGTEEHPMGALRVSSDLLRR